MYVSRETLGQKIGFPQGSRIAVLGEDKSEFDDLLKQYKISDKTDVDTRFVILGEDKDVGLNAYRTVLKNLPYCVVGHRPENVFVNNVLWNGAIPFVADIGTPDFLVNLGKSKREDIEFIVRLIFAVAEKITVDVLNDGISDTVFPVWLENENVLSESTKETYCLAKSMSKRVDGLKQAESALILLKVKEKKNFKRNDTVVLLAKYLAKVYNYFIKYQPTSIFPPDNNFREETLTEFFGVSYPKVRALRSEYEIRKRYYMLSQNCVFLQSLWDNVCKLIDKLLFRHRTYTENNGFCLEEICEDAKFATFTAPDLLEGETLLSFIKDCGVADRFI